MNEIRTRVLVGPDHRISGTAPMEVPEGEHEVTIILTTPPTREDTLPSLPSHDLGPWPASLSLRRQDMYGDGGR